MGVFDAFDWDTTVRDKDNRPVYFKFLNIIYGRNYSGKTTLSRIARALDTGQLPARFENVSFSVEFNDGASVRQDALTTHKHTIRVFNEDFVRDNLAVFYDESQDVAPFAVLGEANARVAAELDAKEKELGSEEIAGSLAADLAARRKEYEYAQQVHANSATKLEDQLREKATNRQTGIKYQSIYDQPNYDIRKIHADVAVVTCPQYVPPTSAQMDEYRALLQEAPRAVPAAISVPAIRYDSLHESSSELLTRGIKPTKPIQELLDNTLLQAWVERGRSLHEGKRKLCGFCGSEIPPDLWERLDRHFSQGSQTLRQDIQTVLTSIDAELASLPKLVSIDSSAFYSAQESRAIELQGAATSAVAAYQKELETIRELLQTRSENIFTVIPPPIKRDTESALADIVLRHSALRREAEQFTASLKRNQSEAREKMRLHEVWRFVTEIRYGNQQEQNGELKKALDKKEELLGQASSKVLEVNAAIAALKNQMRDERNGANKVNEFLKHYFGLSSISLEPVPGDPQDAVSFRFEIRRDGRRAYHLSEGERGLLAFCYFMGRLDDVDTAGSKPIVWIDDPISSLDENHVFFIYSLIRSHLIEKKIPGQLFISTHNLSFLKYLLRVAGGQNVERSYFIVDRIGSRSTIRLMPKHLKDFATEFHYLFHRIYECAHADEANDRSIDVFYGFGNNVRKFLEMYLYFRFPDGDSEQHALTKRLRQFLGENAVAAAVAERVANEYSHLNGLFERGLLPVDIITMKAMAQLILDKIKEHDLDQYNALLASVGESPSGSTSGGSTASN